MMQGGVSNDMYLQTPQLKIDILRDQAASYGVSPTRIETLLRNAYSQNYVYLIKQPTTSTRSSWKSTDQRRSAAGGPRHCSTSQSDDGKRTVPLSAVATWEPTLGPQSVNHLNQFTSVTFNFNLMPGVSLGEATDFIDSRPPQIVPAHRCGEFQGEALTFQRDGRQPDVLMVLAVFVMYVILAILYESYLHPITVLSTLPTALVGGLLTLSGCFRQAESVALRVHRHVHADGHREEERHHDRGLRDPARRRRRDRRAGDPRRQHGPLPPDPDDDAGRGDGRGADRAGLGRRRREPPPAGPGHRRRA